MTIFSLSNSCVRPTIVLRRIEREQASEWVREREWERGEERKDRVSTGQAKAGPFQSLFLVWGGPFAHLLLPVGRHRGVPPPSPFGTPPPTYAILIDCIVRDPKFFWVLASASAANISLFGRSPANIFCNSQNFHAAINSIIQFLNSSAVCSFAWLTRFTSCRNDN